jgi:SpoVK/Ycf46/Vps4 family AAA+-type ATPase
LWNLKEYAQIKKSAFSAEARAAGVDAPKGVLLVGVPGTGKSLSAKAIAGGTMPLLRMDVGSLMGGLVGESEQNIRKALKVAEAVAPCVIWMDEIEKAIGGVESSAQSDGGTLARVFGTLLTWMQETTAPVYVVATANDVRALKPEFLAPVR